jgi:hypothetical protein
LGEALMAPLPIELQWECCQGINRPGANQGNAWRLIGIISFFTFDIRRRDA